MIFFHQFCKILKKYSTSKTPSSGKSVQWIAFFTLSYPNLALIESGFKCFAISGSWGPHNSLNALTAFSYLISKAIHGPVVRCSEIYVASGITPYKI